MADSSDPSFKAIMAYLKRQAQMCDCFAHGPADCVCGAWQRDKSVKIADIIAGIHALKGAKHE